MAKSNDEKKKSKLVEYVVMSNMGLGKDPKTMKQLSIIKVHEAK